jgi:prepilin-type processing-associated H-X9-DG protein
MHVRGSPVLCRQCTRAFTLVELLVVISTIAVLAALLLPALTRAKDASYRAVCLSNLRQVGLAIAAYAEEHQDRIPHGPKAPPFVTPSSLYPSTGAPTSLISLYGGAPVGLGLLIQQHLSLQPRVLFCPGSDQPLDADAELGRVGITQAQASYYYRHAGNTLLSDPPGGPPAPENSRLHSLGKNRNGVPVRALAVDTLFLCPPELAQFGVKPRTHHQRRYADILFADGHAVSRRNQDERYTVNLQKFNELRDAFNRILKVLEQADEEP